MSYAETGKTLGVYPQIAWEEYEAELDDGPRDVNVVCVAGNKNSAVQIFEGLEIRISLELDKSSCSSVSVSGVITKICNNS